VRTAASLILTLAIATAAGQAKADDKGLFGIGLIVGDPSGVSAKYYLSDDTAVDAAAGLGLIQGGVHAHADFLWHPVVLESQDSFVMPLYVGPGLRFLIEDKDRASDDVYHLGLRAVVGTLFDFRKLPLDVFVEVAPILEYKFSDLENEKGFGVAINISAGVRYYF